MNKNKKQKKIQKNASEQSLQKNKKIVFSLILISIPFLFFIILELSLRLFNYGVDNDQWLEVKKGKLILNPEIAYRYFWTKTAMPYSIQDVFDKEKKGNAFRIFVLGESSSAGYPFLPLGSFSRYLQKRLELFYPNSKIEVVNCSMTAINSYTIKDLVPEILEQKPDLILIYTGHNEFYGALGVGSIESFGGSRSLINLVLYLNKFKTFELLKNFIEWSSSLISKKDFSKSDGTLMSRIAKEKMIPLGSDIYKKGVEQFEDNLDDILEMINEKNIPVILGTLVSNLKDQYPFNSVSIEGKQKANEIFERAKIELKSGNQLKAKELFYLAKDLDALRFRASEDFNKTITKLGNKYNYPIIYFDSVFNSESQENIVGDNLMTDHLHPTLKGYQIMGNEFFKKMKEKNYLPKTKEEQIPFELQDSLTQSNFKFSKLDSVIAQYRILVLKNDWPFISKEKKKILSALIKPQNIVDSIAYDFLYNNLAWELAHRKMATYYLHKRDYNSFKLHLDILISQYPIVHEYYQILINEMLKQKRFDESFIYLLKYFEIEPDAYSSKWLGIISLSKNKIEDAIKYLSNSEKINPNDAQVLYNLAGAYFMKKEMKKAVQLINKCCSLEPNYTEAKQFREQLLNSLNN